MKKYKTFEVFEIEPYGKYFRFSLSDKLDDIHYLPKEVFPEEVLKDHDIPVQLTLIADENLSFSSPFGQEAEELRQGIEKILEKYEDFDDIVHDLTKILNDIDARDSLFYLERKNEKLSKT